LHVSKPGTGAKNALAGMSRASLLRSISSVSVTRKSMPRRRLIWSSTGSFA